MPNTAIILLIAIFTVLIFSSIQSYITEGKEIKAQRKLYYEMSVMDRAATVKALLFTLKERPCSPDTLAQQVDLQLFTVDEALRRLAAKRCVVILDQGRSFRSLCRGAQLTDVGREFLQKFYRSGVTYEIGPWGTVISGNTISDSTVTNTNNEIHLPRDQENQSRTRTPEGQASSPPQPPDF